jgi:acyl-homoserine-lactone acylase
MQRGSAWASVGRSLTAVLLVVAACTGEDGDDVESPEGEVIGHGNTYEATIRRVGGVPHISADSLEDLSFGQGWASAEDRACDLADQVIKVRGERSRWFGPGEDDANIDADLAWRSVGIFERSQEEWDDTDGPTDEIRGFLTAYAAGWNAHLEEVGVDGLAGWCAGAEWVRPVEPVELYAYARSIALLASGGNPLLMAAVGKAEPPGSNGWAIGSERSAGGGGMLLANPHFPWEGELRFWEVHLTVPGDIDAYGVQLSGLPGLGIGFTESFAWTHTVSAGNRFTVYRLDLVPGTPTTYVYGDESREMTSEEMTIEVLGDDGSVTEQTRTLWSSHYGPIISVPDFGLPWTDDIALTYRDANIDNDEFVHQYTAMLQADDFDELVQIHEEYAGVPLFNTIAASVDGRAWYGDFSATPNLSDQGLAAYENLRASDFLVRAAADQGLVLLDGSNPVFEWEEDDGARDPGLVPTEELPQVGRDDYVFNANDSFWMPHATEMLEGDYSPLHGEQRTARSPRTRENATVLDDTSPDGPAGEDGKFTLDELADAALANRGFTARALLDDVVARCEGAGPVEVSALIDDDGTEVLPAGRVDVAEACEVLAAWDGTYDLDRSGPPVWREMMNRFDSGALVEPGELWAEPFDPEDPVGTPSGLAESAPGAPDPVLEALARAVQILDAAEVSVEAPLGDVQFAGRNGTRVPVHGGSGRDGTTNVVGASSQNRTSQDPEIVDVESGVFAPGSPLGRRGDEVGYPVDTGTSFLLAVELTEDGPEARALLTYGNPENREDPLYAEATQEFSEKAWRTIPLASDDIEAQATSTVTVRG